MTTTVANPAPAVPTHTLRNLAISAALLAAASAGMWEGAQAVTRHYQQPTTTVSYASTDTIGRTLAGAWHTPAKQGAFIDAASIQTPDVISVVKVAS